MTGGEGMKHTRRMLAAGTDVVGGVNPRKAGTHRVDFGGTPDPGLRLRRRGRWTQTGAERAPSSSYRRPSPRPAVAEAADAGPGLAVVITEGVPVHDSVGVPTTHAASKGREHPRSSARTAPA
ncbi:succinate--CoA ligase [ADP-forming] subunit alpha [Streptomyces badius]